MQNALAITIGTIALVLVGIMAYFGFSAWQNNDLAEISQLDQGAPQNQNNAGGNQNNSSGGEDNVFLDLSNSGLAQLPSYVLGMKDLEELDISNNNIGGALPAEIRQLAKLKILNASNNEMTGVPAEIGQLSELQILDLSNNKLTGLPMELGNLKNLQILNLSGNDYSEQDLQSILQKLPEVNIIK